MYMTVHCRHAKHDTYLSFSNVCQHGKESTSHNDFMHKNTHSKLKLPSLC